jgi:hypothetical protein
VSAPHTPGWPKISFNEASMGSSGGIGRLSYPGRVRTSVTRRGQTSPDMRSRPAVLQPDHLANRASGLGQGLVALGLGGMPGLHDAVAQVVADQPNGHFLQGPGGGGDLRNDVGAPGVGFDHHLQAPDLALDLGSRRR